MPNGPKYEKWNSKVEITETIFKASNYIKGGAEFLPIHIHRPYHIEKTKSPCMIYYHGGGGISGSARGYRTVCDRYALEGDMVVI